MPKAPKVHMAYLRPNAKVHRLNIHSFCGPNPQNWDLAYTIDWAEVTCKGCLWLKDRTSDPYRLEGLEKARSFLSSNST